MIRSCSSDHAPKQCHEAPLAAQIFEIDLLPQAVTAEGVILMAGQPGVRLKG